MRERSSGTDRLNVDEWIETEVSMRRECEKTETDREVTAWEEWEEHRESSMGESEREIDKDDRAKRGNYWKRDARRESAHPALG